jgi:hypothetical protein
MAIMEIVLFDSTARYPPVLPVPVPVHNISYGMMSVFHILGCQHGVLHLVGRSRDPAAGGEGLESPHHRAGAPHQAVAAHLVANLKQQLL